MGEMRKCEIDIFNKIKPELTEIFDIGAEQDTEYYDSHPSAKYHLFEPVEAHYDILVEKLNGVDTVKINNMACTNVTGKDMFHLEAGCFNERPALERDTETVEVDTIRLDEYIEENNIDTFDFIKIDVEGGEYNVLDGLGIYLHKFKFIQLEYGGCFLDVKVDEKNMAFTDVLKILNESDDVKLESDGCSVTINFSDKNLMLENISKILDRYTSVKFEYGKCSLDIKFNGNLMLKDIFEILDGYNFIKLETGEKGTAYTDSMEDYYCCNYLFYKPEYHDLVTG